MYLFCKWLHLVAVISWMCGILYGYRLLIYLRENRDKSESKALLIKMSRKLYKIITMPAMGVAFMGGIGMLALNPAIFQQKWIHVKLLLVFGLLATTVTMRKLLDKLAGDTDQVPSSKTLRILNEVPTLLMLVIVGLAVFRPF
jgi:putative membrane protein